MMRVPTHRPARHALMPACLLTLASLLSACGDKTAEVNQGELAARTAKIYYDSLAAGHTATFYEGKLKPDTVPESYRRQMMALLQQHTSDEQERHKGIDSVRVSRYQYDDKTQTADVFLTLVYGDRTQEEIVVPMIKRDSLWLMR